MKSIIYFFTIFLNSIGLILSIKTKSILIGSYNNTVQLWNINGKCLANLPGHNGPVKAVTWVSNEDSKYRFLSASHDQSILIWHWNKKSKKLEKADKCVGHTESVECIDLNFDKTKVIVYKFRQILIKF